MIQQIKLAVSSFLVILAVLLFSNLEVYAGSEFVHSHTDACMATRTINCTNHSKNVVATDSVKFCPNCQMETQHFDYTTYDRCLTTNEVRTMGCRNFCRSCNVYVGSSGTDSSFSHQVSEEYVACGVLEGEVVARVVVSSSNTAITNQPVTISASTTILNENGISDSFSYSWDGVAGNTKSVSENGSYSVTVVNSSGLQATSSIEVSNIDMSAPTISSIQYRADSITSNSITIDVTGSDDNGKVWYTANGGESWSESGTFTISDGKTYSVGVKDEAGNTSFTSVKRADYPYPYVPPVESTKPAESSGEITSASSNSSVTIDENKNTDKTDEDEDEDENKNKNNDADTVEDKTNETDSTTENFQNNSYLEAVLEREEMEKLLGIYPDIEKMFKEQGYMVPKVYVDNLASGNNTEANEKEAIEDGVSNQDLGLEEIEDLSINDTTNGWVLEQLKSKVSVLIGGIIFASLLLGVVLFWYRPYSGGLYAVGDQDIPNSFYHIKRIFIKRKDGNFVIEIPENIKSSISHNNFRIFLNKYFVHKNQDKQVKICVGNRRLVADLEECIDFTL